MSWFGRKKARQSKQSLGGEAVASKDPPEVCPRCGERMQDRVWHSYLGHLGLHGLADKYFGGDIKAAQKRLRENGRARSDPFPGNGAWASYKPVQPYPPEELPF